MSINPNETARYGITTAQVDAIFARSTAQAVADRDARLRAARWPAEVEDLLVAVVKRVVQLEKRVVALEATRP